MAHLLAGGFDVETAKSSTRRHLIATKQGPEILFRLEANFHEEIPFGGRGCLFLDAQEDDDFVALCDFRDGVRGAPIYLIPAKRLNQELELNQTSYQKADIHGLGMAPV